MAEQYKVKLISGALRDLEGVYKYVGETLLEAGTALNLVEEIEREIFSLEHFRNRCPIRRTGRYSNKGYRQLFVENYTVIFRVNEEDKTVIVVTVHYSASQL